IMGTSKGTMAEGLSKEGPYHII
ncbi:FMRFamide neuropeptide, partial [Bacillus wiedmannii]